MADDNPAGLFPLIAELDEIRADIELASELPMTADPRRVVDRHAPRLLAAVERLLELHRPGRSTILGDLCARHANHRFFSITRTEADAVRDCPDCVATVYSSCAGCGSHMSMDACPVVLIITRELTGKEAGDELG